jgi:hypothetical protein
MRRKRSAQEAQAEPAPSHVAGAPAFHVATHVAQGPDQILDAVRRGEEPAQRGRQIQLHHRQRLLEPLPQTGGRRRFPIRVQPPHERRQLAPGRGRARRPVRPAQGGAHVHLAGLGHEGRQVAPLMELAALNHRGIAPDIAERLAQPLAPIDYAEDAAVDGEPADQPLLQQLGAHHGVLRRAEAQTQRLLAPVPGDAQGDDRRLLGDDDAVHEQGNHVEALQPSGHLRLQPLPGPADQHPADRALAAPARPPVRRPRFQARLVVSRRHPRQQLLHHPRAQRIALAEGGPRRQGRLAAVGAAHAGPLHLQPPPAEGELGRRGAPVVIRAGRLMSPLRPGQRPGLVAKQLVERGEPVRMHPRQQVLPGSRHPGQHRFHQEGQLGAGLIPTLRSLPSLWSLLHWRLLGPGVGDRCLGRPRFSGRPGSRRYSQFANSTGVGTSPGSDMNCG